MATFTERLALLVDARTDGAVRELKKLDGTTKTTGKTADDTQKKYSNLSTGLKVGITAAAAVAAVKLAKFSGEAIDAARDQGEALNKSNVIFKGNAKEVENWASGGAKAFGLSKTAALDAAGSFGNMFDQLGFTGDATQKMSKRMVTLAADFASFHNADITEVLQAQQAGFRGEYDALQRFIPTITAATVQQEAMKETGKKNAQALTAQEKAAATYQIILENAGQAQGDFARTSDSLANQQRIMNAQWDDAKAKLGQALLPAMQKATGFASDMLDKFNDLSPATQNMAVGILAVGGAVVFAGPKILALGSALKTMGVGAKGAAVGLGAMGVAIIAMPALTRIMEAATDSSEGLFDRLKNVNKQIIDTVDPTDRLSTALGLAGDKTNTAATTTDVLKTATEQYGDMLGTQTTPTVADFADATEDAYLKQKLLHDEVVDSTESDIAFRDALADWTTEVRDNIKAGKDHARSLSLTNQLGRDNISGLIDMAKKANEHADAVFKQTGNVDLANKALKTDRQRLLDAGAAAGFNKDELQKLITKYSHLPIKAETKIKQPGMAEAKRQADIIKKKMQELEGTYDASVNVKLWKEKKGDLYFKPYYAADGAIFNAGGNLLSRSEQHVAQVAKPGQWRVWAEDETGGEAYIPLAMSKRSRSVAILKAVAEGFGYQVDAMAAGGVRTTPQALKIWAQRNIQQGADTTAQLVAALLNKHYAPTGLLGALQFAYSQVGKPYLWGAFGPTGYDCSGFMSALVNVARGQNPYSRVGSTQTFPWGGFASGAGPFMIGSFRGLPGHMAGTIYGTNVESAGGVGVRVGSSARGARDSMFGGNIWRLARFDNGGMLYPVNRTGQPERVLSPAQTRSFDRLVRVLDRGGGAGVINVTINTAGVVGMTKMDLDNVFVATLNRVARHGRINTAVRLAAG